MTCARSLEVGRGCSPESVRMAHGKDEEAANLVRFQRAYEANARYFTTINDLLGTLMGMVQ